MKTLLVIILLTLASQAQSSAPKVIKGRTQTHGTFPVPHASGDSPEPYWIAHPYWDIYPMPGFWQCPVGYEQISFGGKGFLSASQHGEISGGSEDYKHQPSCRKPKPPEKLPSAIAWTEISSVATAATTMQLNPPTDFVFQDGAKDGWAELMRISIQGEILITITGKDGKWLKVSRDGVVTGDMPHDAAADHFWLAFARAFHQLCEAKKDAPKP